jgi:RNA polymerase sigma-70 factor, ECF subfamily
MQKDDMWLIQGLTTGDQEAVRVFCERYGPMLQEVADRHLAAGLRRRVGPESVCQSACLTFLRRAKAGEFRIEDKDDLWRLVFAITLSKVREKARYHRRQKRSIDREHSLDAMSGSPGEKPQFDPVDSRPTSMEAAEFEEQFDLLMSDLNEEERKLTDLKLQQYTNDEIANRMGCSERTVRRILNRVKDRLKIVQEKLA